MGSGSGQVFAAASIPTVFLARDHEKAREGLDLVQRSAKSERIADFISLGTYDEDMAGAIADADIIFEALAEDLDLKRKFFDVVDQHRKPDSIVATVSSGLSIGAMAAGRSESFRRNFLGIHLFNPPNVIVGCEVIPHVETDPALVSDVVELLKHKLGREVICTADEPAFCGNRVGFMVLNEVAILAAEHGVAFIDALVGPHTGRALTPLATVDLVGWDVHQAIVDNVYANTNDEAHERFALPDFMKRLIESGHLGNKTPEKGGFYRRVKENGKTETYVLDPSKGEYHRGSDTLKDLPDFVQTMKKLHHVGRYSEAMRVFLEAKGWEADLLRKVILGYVSYGLNRVGEVVEKAADVDRIMGFGFNWAPPTVLVDFMGVKETIAAIEKAGLLVPPVLLAHGDGPMFHDPHVDRGRFFIGG
jgi:3-hydroxyacyl-CoA dehydrogenase